MDAVSTGMLSSCSRAIPLPPRSLDDLSRNRLGSTDDTVLAAALRAVERAVRGGDEHVDPAGLGERRDAEARGDRDPLASGADDLERLERRAGALCHRRAAGCVGARENERELLAAPPSGDVDLPSGVAQGAGERAQHEVARGVPEAVVDVLEPVEVGEDEAEVAAEARRPGDLRVERLLEETAIRKLRQRIDERLLLHDPVQLGVLERDRRVLSE